MIGITAIGTYTPEGRISNLDRTEEFGTTEDFVRNKIGIEEVSIKGPEETVTDMCEQAFADLQTRHAVDKEAIEAVILVTQNPDARIPHTSAMIHGRLELPESCAVFDISLGCSGYVYGLSVIKSLMEAHGMRHGLLFTCDPYSVILDPEDKNTSLLFGDAAAVTYLSDAPQYEIGQATFGTIGQEGEALQCGHDGKLFMNGRSIFNFAARYVPKDVETVLAKNDATLAEVDRFLFHQGSKYIIDTIIRRVSGIEAEKVDNTILHHGNTVSSSIPLMLYKYLGDDQQDMILISGFGVGLSWSTNILRKAERK